MIKTGGTKFLRRGGAINKRVQDGITYPLLCEACETKTSVLEKEFAEKVFKKSVELGSFPKKTGNATFCFVASVHQRVQAYLLEVGNIEQLRPSEQELLRTSIKDIGEFLCGTKHNLTDQKLYLIPLGVGELSSTAGMPTNWNRFIRRQTEFDLMLSESGSIFASYYKIGPWVSVCLLKNDGQPWIGGQVLRVSSRFVSGTSFFPPSLLEFLADRAERTQRTFQSMSPKQKEKAQKAILEGDFQEAGRPMLDAFLADYEAFGAEAFDPD